MRYLAFSGLSDSQLNRVENLVGAIIEKEGVCSLGILLQACTLLFGGVNCQTFSKKAIVALMLSGVQRSAVYRLGRNNSVTFY